MENDDFIQRYVDHARAHGYEVKYNNELYTGEVLLKIVDGEGRWQFCQVPSGDLVQYVHVNSRRKRSHQLLTGDYFGIHLVLRGKLEFKSENGGVIRNAVGPTAIAVHKPGEPGVSFELAPGWVEMLSFYFSMRRFRFLQKISPGINQFLGFNRSEGLQETNNAKLAVLPIDITAFSNAGKNFAELPDIEFSSWRRLKLEAIGVHLLESFCRFVENSPNKPQVTSYNSAAAIANELALNAPNGYAKTEDAAARLAMSASKFKKLYREQTGETYKDFRQSSRQAKAFVLLQNSNLSIEQIAAMLGYQYASSFCRSFKRQSGVTPTEARRLFSSQ